jgi:hypothetical protein
MSERDAIARIIEPGIFAHDNSGSMIEFMGRTRRAEAYKKADEIIAARAERLSKLRIPESGVDYGMSSETERSIIRAQNAMLDRCIRALAATPAMPAPACANCSEQTALVNGLCGMYREMGAAPVDAEPVVWRWRHVNDAACEWYYTEISTKIARRHNEYIQAEPLYARPASPVMADVEKARETIISRIAGLRSHQIDLEERDALLTDVSAALAKMRAESDHNNQKAST